jgi:hypothetical protein
MPDKNETSKLLTEIFLGVKWYKPRHGGFTNPGSDDD